MSHLKRRSFIKALSGTTLLSVAGGLPLSAETQSLPFSLLTQPYLQHPTEDGMTICWIVSKPAFSWVEYWEEGDSAKKVRKQSIEEGISLAHNTVNRIRLDQLQAGKRYFYQVFSKEIVEFLPYKKTFGSVVKSAEFSFLTVDPGKEAISMLILNDIHDRPQSFAALEKLVSGQHYDEVFLNGDMFDYQTDQQQLIDHLIAPCTGVFASEKPFLFVRGNHETRGVFTYQLKNYFENIGKGPYFSFSRGPVFFVALDTGEDKEDDHEAYYGMAAFDPFREEQAAWLEKILQTTDARKASYRVVLMHIPPLSFGRLAWNHALP
ncbi:metallophosphoesterase family protein [Olivibacter sp. CPCC 100613]|uniref:metallophosphoesterase family protein n=1 Tax=Olivibacter sp. CPCC 100613 TaxID=3079931 RepID=UPI002FF96B91